MPPTDEGEGFACDAGAEYFRCRGRKGAAMARTAVDLPDPQQTPADGGANNADDLLAQLAGEEVDRLLSEAEGNATDPLNVDAERGGNKGNRGEASLSELFGDLDEAEKSALADAPPAPAVAATATAEPIAAPPDSAADAL